MTCNDFADFQYPYYADIYYPMLRQGNFNEVKKEWIFGTKVTCYVAPLRMNNKAELSIEQLMQLQHELSFRSRHDIRTFENIDYAMNNVLITNIRSSSGDLLYRETAGARSGKGSIYELATIEPVVGPFGVTDYFNMVIRRTENQAVDN